MDARKIFDPRKAAVLIRLDKESPDFMWFKAYMDLLDEMFPDGEMTVKRCSFNAESEIDDMDSE